MQATAIMLDQIGALRFRQILAAFDPANKSPGRRQGFLVSSDFLVDPVPSESPPFDRKRALELGATPTRLTRLDPGYARAVVNWGYIATDHRVRNSKLAPVRCRLPYADSPVRL